VVDTPWQSRAVAAAADPAKRLAQLQSMQPNGRLVTAEQVAAAIAFLASPVSGATTGIELPVDGGMQAVHVLSASLAQA
jgi:2-keto-3-deoxy-L-fuconate dehydrogenase